MNPVNVIVPVYRGLQDVKDCLESVRAAPCRSAYELIVIDDSSPEPAVSEYLRQEAAAGKFTLLVNEVNLGFVATVNRGMQLHPDRDVILLNSDTQVANNWLDRLVDCAYAADNIGTVTPFSNNATICSFPDFCKDNDLLSHWSVAQLDNLFALCNAGKMLDIPTAIGFCMYIRRACLDKVGYFDVETFGKGYGEENDFCQRALGVGWRSCFTLDTFVYHTGNVSFGDEHNDLKHAAMGKLLARHPTYEQQVHQHILQDPARPYRERVWLASLRHSPLPLVVHVAHNRGGGTARFVEELSDELSGQASSLILMPSSTKPGYLVLARVQTHAAALPPEEPGYGLYFHAVEEQKALVKLLASLPISNFHFHHLVGLPDWVQQLPRQLSLPWYVSFHDYYMACPQISLTDHYGKYCEEKGVSACNACLKLNPAPNEADIESWRNSFRRLIDEATICFAPSIDCQTRMEGYFPDANIVTAYHQQSRHIAAATAGTSTESIGSGSASRADTENSDRPLKVLVLGALSQIKGADTLEALAVHSQKVGLPIDFTLLGYAYRTLITLPHSRLHVGGAYQESQLAGMLEEKKRNGEADLVWFTALWPETFSYTLSAAIEAGLPILAPNIGAFSERLYRRPYSWVLPWNASITTIADLLLRIKGVMLQGQPAAELATFESVAPFASSQYLYNVNYLNGLHLPELSRFPESSALPDATRKATLHWVAAFARHFQPRQTWKERFRYQMLLYLVRLRGLPIMRTVVRKIPPGMQRRIKDRLLR